MVQSSVTPGMGTVLLGGLAEGSGGEWCEQEGSSSVPGVFVVFSTVMTRKAPALPDPL